MAEAAQRHQVRTMVCATEPQGDDMVYLCCWSATAHAERVRAEDLCTYPSPLRAIAPLSRAASGYVSLSVVLLLVSGTEAAMTQAWAALVCARSGSTVRHGKPHECKKPGALPGSDTISILALSYDFYSSASRLSGFCRPQSHHAISETPSSIQRQAVGWLLWTACATSVVVMVRPPSPTQ